MTSLEMQQCSSTISKCILCWCRIGWYQHAFSLLKVKACNACMHVLCEPCVSLHMHNVLTPPNVTVTVRQLDYILVLLRAVSQSYQSVTYM